MLEKKTPKPINNLVELFKLKCNDKDKKVTVCSEFEYYHYNGKTFKKKKFDLTFSFLSLLVESE